MVPVRPRPPTRQKQSSSMAMRRSSTSSRVKPTRLATPAAMMRVMRRNSGPAGTSRRTSPVATGGKGAAEEGGGTGGQGVQLPGVEQAGQAGRRVSRHPGHVVEQGGRQGLSGEGPDDGAGLWLG